MIETLSNSSNIALYIAMVVYAAAFIFFTIDLATRGAKKQDVAAKSSALGATERSKQLVGAGASAEVGGEAADAGILRSSVVTSSGSGSGAVAGQAAKAEPRWRDQRGTVSQKIAMVLTVVAFVAHLAATVLRGIAAERVPWSNMFEYTMTSTLLIVLVFLAVQFWQDLRFLGTFITGFVVLSLGVATVGFYVDVVPLQPALQSWWLVIHVFVASLGTGFLALGFGLSLLQLLQARREAKIRAGEGNKRGWLSAMPSSERLEDLAFRVNVIGFIFWTFTLVAGAIWAERAWGRYWGWDTKEVWTFIIWVVYAGYLHARGTRGWRGAPSAWLSIAGFATVVFNFGIVNVFFTGLHAYSGM
ncbi:c-type cytochrome biogenesis protein CcsB [Gulosibacter molinativorax]|uniref:C-type cytochrome biogenesis protein CcsB n=1 Tax=Gulosibacter molinativorax TaxID=256821 RepID=A0ABT7CAT6_9MICO|nr:c-type cytochrome biogenesis protein CcsB [Gulosibacter molinativorax]MDJ1372311.1 c-type cytochrome biogenesis protein CcsB [Gulosibacter molinativorax]QUY63405.1 Putative cytochrome C-type biogenesis protein [Gulosibacter molinativorax]